MKKILPLALAIVFSCTVSAQELLDTWTLHYMIIDGTTINTPNSAAIEFYESSQGYEAFAIIYGGINSWSESEPPMTIEADTFTIQSATSTLGDCFPFCELESNYFGTILGYGNRTFDYEITTATNGDRTLVVRNPEGNIAVHGDFILSNPENKQSPISLFPNPAENQLHLLAQGITVSSVNIFSIEGKQVSEMQFSENGTLDVSYLTAGLYFLELKDIEGKRYVHKFLKR